MSYRSEVEMEVNGEADFTVPTSSTVLNGVINASGLFEDTDLESTVDLPASFSLSLSHRVGKLTWLSFGLSYLLDKQLSVDVGYSHLFVDDAKIDNELESGVPTLNATLTGEYEADVDILSAQLNWQLD